MLIDEIRPGKDFSIDFGSLDSRFARAAAFLRSADFSSLPPGRTEIDGDDVFVSVQEYVQEEREPAYEAHDRYADIQLVLKGSERFRWGYGTAGAPEGDFRQVTGVGHFAEFTLRENQFVIFFPGEAHAPGLPESGPAFCRKAVIKVRVND